LQPGQKNKSCANKKVGSLVYGIQRHFQQYFSYNVASGLLVEETGVLPGEHHQPRH